MWGAKGYNKVADMRSWWSMMSLFDTMSEGVEYSKRLDDSKAQDKNEKLSYGDVFASSAHGNYLRGIVVVLMAILPTRMF